ncbi:hypothetical protein ACFWP3_39195 [Streptomyces sp. NPDC058525]|uniref:hypothetical protein n=1 Tax=Streptomyces sp. NPDC058525 TaxID=3346538 RepID=UPI003659A1D9
MFNTRDDLDQFLTNSLTWSALYAVLLDSSNLAAQTLTDENTTGLRFFEPSPRFRTAPISGTVTINPDTGAITLAAEGFTGASWYDALHRLGTLDPNDDGTPFWSWRPYSRDLPGTLAGTVHLGPRITAEAAVERHSASKDTANATLCLTPATRDICHLAWAFAVTVLGTLTTGNTAYRSDILPAPDPEVFTAADTDYPAAAKDATDLCALLDENETFGYARDHDPTWPADAERAAVRALRAFRDVLTTRTTTTP